MWEGEIMNLTELTKILEETFNPISIFLYGSMATNTNTSKSDYDIGIIFTKENYVRRTKIKEVINDNKFSIFPFRIEELKNGNLDTPFQKNIYLRTLISGAGKTVSGEQIIENLDKPNIKLIDILTDLHFYLGNALSSVLCYKSNNIELANELFYKSCLFATRDLLMYRNKKTYSSYIEIYNEAVTIDLPLEYQELVSIAYNIRNQKVNTIDEKIYYKNITYMNQYIEKELLYAMENTKNWKF